MKNENVKEINDETVEEVAEKAEEKAEATEKSETEKNETEKNETEKVVSELVGNSDKKMDLRKLIEKVRRAVSFPTTRSWRLSRTSITISTRSKSFTRLSQERVLKLQDLSTFPNSRRSRAR